jgi:sulfate transporter 4
MKAYRWRDSLKADAIAGITVGTMLIPQAMSYAKLAGLHPIYGLYSGFVPIFTYALFGSSRQLAIGPVALVSLLVSNGLAPLVDQDNEVDNDQYTRLAILLALMVGLLEVFMGLIRLGWLIRFISHSIISGFTTGSAIIIGLSQVKSFLGYEVTGSSKFIPLVQSIIAGRSQFKWQPFTLGCAFLTVLLIMKHLGKNYKHLRMLRAAGPLTAVVSGTIFVKMYHPQSISVVGPIPQGLPAFSVNYDFASASKLLPTAALICGVAILESVGIAKALAAKNGYEIDSNQELFGLGVANVLGSAFSAYPTTGSFSRSAVMQETGAKTGFAGVFMGLLVTSVLLFLTPLFAEIPQCALAAIVISAVIGLVDYNEAIFLWRVEKKDFLLWIAASFFTLFLGVEIGVLIGVGLSLVFVIYETANPHMAVLGRLPGTTVYRNILQYPDAFIYHGIVILRIDSPIYFANINFIKERLREFEHHTGVSANKGYDVGRIRFLIIEMSPVTYIDSTGIHAIKEIYYAYKSRNVQMALCNPSPRVMATLARAGIPDLIGLSWYFVRVHDAVQVCLSHLQGDHPAGDEITREKSSSLPLKRGSHERWSQDGHPSSWRREPSRSDLERSSLLTSDDSNV